MEYLLKASAVLLIFYVCYKLILHRDTFFQSNRWFLLSGFIIALCIPYLVIPIYVTYTPISIDPSKVSDGLIMSQANTNTSIDVLTLLSWVYLCGLLFFTIRFFINVSSLVQVINNGTIERYGKYNFVKTSINMPPFSFFNWIVFNPSHFNNNELELILNHEKIHANQWHSIDIIISQLVSIVFWFNPIVWLYRKALQQNLEFIADHKAQHISSCNSSYQKLLLKTSVKGVKLSLVNNFYSSLIKKRIVMLHKNRSKRYNQWKPLLVLPLLAIFLMSFNTKTIFIEAESEPTSTSFINDYSVNTDMAYHTYLGDIATPNNAAISTVPKRATTTKPQEKVVTGYKSNASTSMIVITKDYSKADFEKAKELLAKEGITATFKNIKRNSKGEITGLKIVAKSKNSQVSYSSKEDDAIEPITINYSDDTISIGEGHKMHSDEYHFTTKSAKIVSGKNKGNNVFVYSTDDEHNHDDEHEHEDVKVFISKNGKKHKIKSGKGSTFTFHSDDDDDENEVIILKDGDDDKKVIVTSKGSNVWTTDENITIKKIGDKGENFFFISSDDDDDGNGPLFIMDGKEISRKEMKALDTDKIESINVLKGESATKKYGDKAKNGVVEITTKK